MKDIKIIAIAMVIGTVMLSSFAFYIYQILFTPNILVEKHDQFFMIERGATFKDVQNNLYDQGIVNDLVAFSFLAKMKDYDENIKPGMYLMKQDMSNLDAINMLRSGTQAPVKLTFSHARRIEDLAAKLTMNLALDSAQLAPVLTSDSVARAYGFDRATFISMFLPNTYNVYWTYSPKELLDRMKYEYDQFWTDARKKKADSLGLSLTEVATLASIVDAETNYMGEAPRIAGVYLNRIKRGYPLQADPTLVFAIGDHSIRRVLNKHKQIDSPYNTYKYKGLPPGPIMMPSLQALEAVLKAENHRYLYFCASPDFSGKHLFARNIQEHNRNAAKFQAALNKQRIYK